MLKELFGRGKEEVPTKILMQSANRRTPEEQQVLQDIAEVLEIKGEVVRAFCSRGDDGGITVDLSVKVKKEDEKAVTRIVKKYTGQKW